MEFEKTYSIKKGKWTKWADTVADAIDDFYSVYSFFPNILLASDHTFSLFDFMVNLVPGEKQKVFSEDAITETMKRLNETDTDHVSITSFNYKNMKLKFAIDNQLAFNKFILIYDDNPDWDNEPEIINDGEKKLR